MSTRLVVAMMKHETNTFSPVVTDWARFEAWSALTGEQVESDDRTTPGSACCRGLAVYGRGRSRGLRRPPGRTVSLCNFVTPA